MPQTQRPVALLVSRSMAKAHQLVTTEFGWEPTGQGQYRTPEGQEVHAVADRSTGFMHRPHGTPVYLLANWLLRDDQRVINEKLASGVLVQVPLLRATPGRAALEQGS
jgi:hypothetical protein